MKALYEVPKDILKANDFQAKIDFLQKIKRSFSVYRIDVGSCNGCEIETFAAITPMWDPERFGFKLVPSPRHADILLCSGPVTRQMYYPLLRAYEATPDPKIVVAHGACAISGGIFHDCYSVWGGVPKVIDVDVFIPGCPPHPASIIYGLAVGLGLLEQKMQRSESKDEELEFEFTKSLLGDRLFERDILATSKRLMGYVFGRKLNEKYLSFMREIPDCQDANLVREQTIKAMQNQSDPRYAECMAVLHNEVYLSYKKGEIIDKDSVKWAKE